MSDVSTRMASHIDAPPARSKDPLAPSTVTVLRMLRRTWVVPALVALLALAILAYGGYFLGWTWTGFSGNTLWDWLSLLVTPVTLGIISLAFTVQQGKKSLLESENQRQEAAVEACIERLSALMVERDLKQSPPGSPVRDVARAHILAAWQRVDDQRRAVIFQFLDDSGLRDAEHPIIDLPGDGRRGAGTTELA
ncbi:MAG: hypothetical protein ACHQ4H_04785 [Ktedonobacterales bacterium]